MIQPVTEEIDGVLLTDGRNSIFLHPQQPFPDGHGYHHQVDLVAEPFRGSIDATSHESSSEVMRAFRSELVALYETLIGEASLSDPYDCLSITLTGDGRGHVGVQVLAAGNDHLFTSKLSFRFALDQTQLPAIIAAVERVFLT